MSEEPFSHTQLFQQAIATTITCRTIIKYNSNLNAEQKAEILTEIESTLTFLEKRLEVNATLESSPSLSPEKLADLLAADIDEEDLLEAGTLVNEREELHISLQNLHKLYHSYLSNEPGRGVAALETRYKVAMDVLDQLQGFAAQRHDTTSGNLAVEGQLHRVRGFISAVYYMFREFAALLSNIVEGKGIDTDTEALALLQKSSLEEAQQQGARDIAPLLYVYNKHIRLQEHKGPLAERARDATAFLIFLEESLEPTLARRKEIAAQLQAIAGLLNELTSLLVDYEQAIAIITQAPSTSR